jgi:thiosulfate/3-mercaptopyruvate sulfurtransferase
MFTNLMCAGLLLTCGGGDASKQAYPGGKLLVEADALGAKPKDFRILDVRPRAAFDRGHVPGAVWVDPAAWAKEFAAGQEADAWAGRIGKLGIEQDSHVVLYDDSKAKDAARIWWILRYFGLKDARLLNGGWSGWQKAGQPVSTEAAPPRTCDFVITAPSSGRLATKQRILTLLKDASKAQIIDARSEDEHCGLTKLTKRGGAIPGSLHLEWSDALDPGTHKFKSSTELTRILKNAGIDLNKPAITYCQSGGRAAVMAFTLELMGARDVANYYRSWAEWGNAEDTPIELPKK